MTYANANIASNASLGQLFCQSIDATLTAELGISKVDAAVVSGTFTWNVYKSAAGTNSLGLDWYFAFGWPNAGGAANNSVCLCMFEGYNNGTHQASNYAPRVNTVAPAANFANPTAASNLPSVGANICYVQTANIPSNFSYAYSVNANRVHVEIFSNTGPINAALSVGIRDTPLPSTIDPFPIYCLNLSIAATVGVQLANLPTAVSGFQTREPNTTSGQNINFGIGSGAASMAWNSNSCLSFSTSTADVYTGQAYTSRVAINGRLTSGSFLGLLKDIYMGPVQTNNGDQMQFTLNGTTYTGTRMNATGLYFLNI